MFPLRNLESLAVTLPVPPSPGGAYDPVRVLGSLVFVAAQFPFRDGALAYQGRLGQELSTDDGYLAARLCALNVLAHLHHTVGLHRIRGVGRVEAFVQTAPGWDDFPRVVDGASHVFLEVLGDAGRHARSLIGVERLPLDAPIELTAVCSLA